MAQPENPKDIAGAEAQSPLLAVSNTMTKLHKDHFGRGPTPSRAHFAGPDMLICALGDVLLPAERKLNELGLQEQVRHSRVSFQAAVKDEFVAAIEGVTQRKVNSFASAVYPDDNMVFEVFSFEPRERSGGANGSVAAGATDS